MSSSISPIPPLRLRRVSSCNVPSVRLPFGVVTKQQVSTCLWRGRTGANKCRTHRCPEQTPNLAVCTIPGKMQLIATCKTFCNLRCCTSTTNCCHIPASAKRETSCDVRDCGAHLLQGCTQATLTEHPPKRVTRCPTTG